MSFSTSFFDDFLIDFGVVLEAKIDPQIEFWHVFLAAFFDAPFYFDFWLVFMLA